MSKFTSAEIEYLQSQRIGRIATVDSNGDLHVVPCSFRYNPDEDTIDLGGVNIVPSKKYRDALRHGRTAFVVDDILPPWQPRFVEIRGTVQAFPDGGQIINQIFVPDILRVTPTYIVSMGVNDTTPTTGEGKVIYDGRKVG